MLERQIFLEKNEKRDVSEPIRIFSYNSVGTSDFSKGKTNEMTVSARIEVRPMEISETVRSIIKNYRVRNKCVCGIPIINRLVVLFVSAIVF